jgi:integrase
MLDASSSPETYRPVIAVLAFTGLRIQECLGLVWNDVNLEKGVPHARAQLTRATREVPARRWKRT